MVSYKNSWTQSLFRRALVFFVLGLVTWNYFLFSHFVHQTHHFNPPHGKPSSLHEHGHDDEHGRKGSFDNFHLKKDGLFLYGFALPLLLLTLAALVWNPSSSTKGTTTRATHHSEKERSRGDPNVQKWTLICFVLPLFLVMFDGARGHDIFHSNTQDEQRGWNLYVRICMSLMSPSGYAATWALAFFLIPVTKHSPILDWLNVTPVQALAFHRVAGWTSFWNSVLHGFLHLRHLMDVLNPQCSRTRYQQLKLLLIPSSWKCFGTQNPLEVFFGRQDPLDGTEEEAEQCWLALVNLTGFISVVAFVLLAITSLPQVRRYSYALFYSVHIPSAWVMLIMAIWHYPTCALVLIPNIIYYISFNIPVYVTQNMDNWILGSNKDREPINSPLVEANLIEGGSLELVFATKQGDFPRHENRFARILCPAVSPLSHPFSTFSQQDLKQASSDDAMNTISVLLRPSGSFTENLTKKLFPNYRNDETTNQESTDDSMSRPLIGTSLPCTIQVDSYYAGSFHWVDRAMKSHDEILLVAGGVGIVPFLEFLPSLQQRIKMDTASIHATGSSLEINESLLESNIVCGPRRVHLHWYCREIGLASYVWNKYLSRHVEEAWEGNPYCQSRLRVHLHLTSMNPTSASVSSIHHNSGLIQKESYSSVDQQGMTHRVKDPKFTQTWWVGLFFPGSLMIAGTILHWWWYKKFVIAEKFRHDNLIIRSHSIVFALGLAILLSILTEKIFRKHDKMMQDSGVENLPQETEFNATSVENQNSFSPENHVLFENSSFPGQTTIDDLVTVTGGRPSIDSVIDSVLQSDRPGVYSCGPRSLMESLESAIEKKCSVDCALYREDSEM